MQVRQCVKISCFISCFSTILTQTPNATRNETEFDRSMFSMRTKMTNISQKQPANIMKPLIFVCDKGSLSCVLIGQNLISLILRAFFKLKNLQMHLVILKQDHVREYRLTIFLFKVELRIVEINVLQTRTPIPPMLNQYPRNSLKQSFFLHYS